MAQVAFLKSILIRMHSRDKILIPLILVGLIAYFFSITLNNNVPSETDGPLSAEQAEEKTPGKPSKPESRTKYAATSVEMELKRVSEHVYYVQGKAGIATDNEGFVANASVVITGDGVVLFDALGTPSLANKLLGLIREITDQPITRVVMSHYHADHVYGLQVFEETGAEIIAPYGANQYINSDAATTRLEERRFSLDPWVNKNTYVVLPDQIVEKGMQFKLGVVDFTINYLGPAHSNGDLAMYIEPDKVLLSGDIIFEGRIPFIGNGDTGHWLKTLERMETTGLNALIPGHGPASTSPNETISLTRRYLAFMREKMGAAVEELQSFDEVYTETNWSEFESLPAFEAGNRINAYQVYLSMEAELLSK